MLKHGDLKYAQWAVLTALLGVIATLFLIWTQEAPVVSPFDDNVPSLAAPAQAGVR